jgi:predicted membrane channel-forming protein YqfA (hemolysin III family)
MGIGVGILLMAVGAILTFAVHATVSGISIQTVGVILMIAGLVGVLLDLVIFMPRRRVTRQQVYSTAGTAVPGRTVVTDSTDDAVY